MYDIDRTRIEESIINIPVDDFNLLYSTEDEIQERMNNAYREWRIVVRKFDDVEIIFIDVSYTWCNSLNKVCEILNIRPYEQNCIQKISNFDTKYKMYKNIDYIINLTILRQMRRLNKR